jgi:probable HAF family extracellular repeat protein
MFQRTVVFHGGKPAMSHFRAVAAAFASLATMLASSTNAVGAPIYSITDLGRLVGTGLNNTGQVVGNALGSDNGAPPGGGGFLYDGYGPHGGTVYAFGKPFQPTNINDSGLIIGSASNGDGAFGYGTAEGVVTTIQNQNAYIGPVSTINAQGQALVNESGPPGLSQTIIQSPDGSHTEVGHLPGEPLTTGMAINNSGQVAGWTGMDNTARAFLYSQGIIHSLGTLPGDTWSMAFGLNNSGQVVGYSVGSSGVHAFLYSNGTMQSLGTLGGNASLAMGINAGGEIYGRSTLADGTTHAFLYQAGKMLDLTNFLHTLPNPISNFTYYDVNGINDRGQLLILASNTNSDFHSFLLTPQGLPVPTAPSSVVVVPVTVSEYTPPPVTVPEPSVLACFLTVAAASAGRRILRRKRTCA